MSATSDDILPGMLMRLKLSAMGERLDNLLDEAARRDLSLREALALLCEAEVQHREERRVRMGTGIAKFPFVRTASRSTRSPRSTASRFAASPPVAGLPTAIHCCCWGRWAWARRTWPWRLAAKRSGLAIRCCSCRRPR
jgi:hypothetical protein